MFLEGDWGHSGWADGSAAWNLRSAETATPDISDISVYLCRPGLPRQSCFVHSLFFEAVFHMNFCVNLLQVPLRYCKLYTMDRRVLLTVAALWPVVTAHNHHDGAESKIPEGATVSDDPLVSRNPLRHWCIEN